MEIKTLSFQYFSYFWRFTAVKAGPSLGMRDNRLVPSRGLLDFGRGDIGCQRDFERTPSVFVTSQLKQQIIKLH